MAGRKIALLIGIRTYPNIPRSFGSPLNGPHNDVETMRGLLVEKGFADVRILVDKMDEGCDCAFCSGEDTFAAPTRDGIRAAVRQLASDLGEDDDVVVYYSGHGSELYGRELYAGRRFQTLVPLDSGRGEHPNRDITDREIELWILRFNEATSRVTMIFDSCHSGGVANTRGARDESVGRRVEAGDEGEVFDQELRDAAGDLDQEPDRASSGWLRRPGRSCVLLAGCGAHELSVETVVDGKANGLFTLQLNQALRRRDTTGLRWSEIHPGVAEKVSGHNVNQHPRREGDSPVFAAGYVDPDDTDPPDVVELKRYAVVVGIDYGREEGGEEEKRGFPPLRTPKTDADEVARVLGDPDLQAYEIVGLSRRQPGALLNEQATRKNIQKLIQRLAKVKVLAHPDSAVVIYFAGHGVVQTDEDGNYQGYLIPWDADRGDPSTWLSMKDLRDQLLDGISDEERLARLGHSKSLTRLVCRHLLLVLDCCFGGALSFDFYRGGGLPERPVYYSEYRRFVEGTAWQLLTSASYNQQAMDRNPTDPGQVHSPFAQALIEGLTTDHADVRQGARSDHIVTASELHQYVDRRLKAMGVDIQTPGLTPLRPIEGQFIFRVPGFQPTPAPDPVLDSASNPWRGAGLFDPRQSVTLDEIRVAIEIPAAARVLFFEPPSLVDTLIEEVASAASPLALVSLVLAGIYEAAWGRRATADRLLTYADYKAVGGTVGVFGALAEKVTSELATRGGKTLHALQSLLFRLAPEGRNPGRPVTREERKLHDSGERQKLEGIVLPELLEKGVLVERGDRVELTLADAAVLDHWPTLDRWIREDRERQEEKRRRGHEQHEHHEQEHGPEEPAPTSQREKPKGLSVPGPSVLLLVRREVGAWNMDRQEPGTLWEHNPILSDLVVPAPVVPEPVVPEPEKDEPTFVVAPGLNEIERDFAVASEAQRRAALAGRLASDATKDLVSNWSRSALLAAEAGRLALEGHDESQKLDLEGQWNSLARAEQALHEVLAATPLSLPYSVPEKVLELRFYDDVSGDRVLHAQTRDGALVWDLCELGPPSPVEARESAERPPESVPVTWDFAADGPPPPPLPLAELFDLHQGGDEKEREPIVRLLGKMLRLGEGARRLVDEILRWLKSRHWLGAQAGRDKAVRYFPPGYLAGPRRLSRLFKEPTQLLGHREIPTFLAFARAAPPPPPPGLSRPQTEPDGWLATAAHLPHGQEGTEVRLWRIRDRSHWGIPGEPATFLAGDDSENRFRKIAFDADGYLAAQRSGECLLWDLRSLEPHPVRKLGEDRFPDRELPPPDIPRELLRDFETPTCVAVLPDGRLAVGFAAEHLHFLDPAAKKWSRVVGPPGHVTALATNAAAKRLAVGYANGTVCLFPTRPGRHQPVVLGSSHGETLEVLSLAFDQEGKRLAVGRHAAYSAHRNQIDVYHLDIEELMMLARGHAGRKLDPRDLPGRLWQEIFGTEPPPRQEPPSDSGQPQPEERYLRALGVLPADPDRKPPEVLS